MNTKKGQERIIQVQKIGKQAKKQTREIMGEIQKES